MKAVGVAVVEVLHGEPGFGHIRPGHLPSARRSSLEELVRAKVDPEAKACVEDRAGHDRLEDERPEYLAVNVSASDKKAHELSPASTGASSS